MTRKILGLLAVSALFLSMLPAVAQTGPARQRDAAGPELVAREVDMTRVVGATAPKPDFGTGSERRTYLISLRGDAVPAYTGGVSGLEATAARSGERFDVNSSKVRAYRGHLLTAQEAFISRMNAELGRSVQVLFKYQLAGNGIAAVMTPAEARRVYQDSAVVHISQDKTRELHTDRGPAWSGAPAVWQGTDIGLPQGYRGEGMVVGIIDTGINPSNDSFKVTSDDGYTHTNPRDKYYGVCDEDSGQYDPNFPCNDKLIGAWGFVGDFPGAVDYDGHGSHVSGTAAGGVVTGAELTAPTDLPFTFDISGVAPRANIISYLGCCTVSGLTAAIEQAIDDEVDAINYSIGSTAAGDPWTEFDDFGFLMARAAGIFVATSAGNAGPGYNTVGSPGNAPWLTTVGNSSHDRRAQNSLTNLQSDAQEVTDLVGVAWTAPLAVDTALVYAGDHGDALCGETTGNEAAFTGKIVVCDRGIFGRVEKSFNVKNQGAVGYVLLNDQASGDSLVDDAYAVPGVFLTYSSGQALMAFLGTGSNHTARISGTEVLINDDYGDILSSSSSRGRNRAIDVIVPSVTAPGTNIFAPYGFGNPDNYNVKEYGVISGTSMASPHVAGAGALIMQARPTWTPAQIQSALMTTARHTVLNHDGQPADPYQQGSGHIDVGRAVNAGLLFDETFANYIAANPADGGDPRTLNIPNFAHTSCVIGCSWTRTATAPASAPANVTWSVSTMTDTGLSLDVILSQATLSGGDSTTITVNATADTTLEGQTLFGRITLTPSNDSVPTVTMPVAVVPSGGVLPDEVEINTRRNAGSAVVEDILSIEVTDFHGSLSFVEAFVHEGTIVEDPTWDDPFDDLNQVDVFYFNIPAGTTRFLTETMNVAGGVDLDLIVGTGDVPSWDTIECIPWTSSGNEICDISDPEAGNWWVVIQNWWGSTPTNPDPYTFVAAIFPEEGAANGGVAGPAGTVPAGEPYDVTVFWDIPEMEEGSLWLGTAVLGSSPATPGNIGSFDVVLRRAEDDVFKTASVGTATNGDTISYEITIRPNVTPSAITYTITDTVPAGFTIDAASVTGGGVVDGQTITWNVVSTAQGVGDYVVSTPSSSAACAQLGGLSAPFIDLAQFVGLLPYDGDTTGFHGFSEIGPFPLYGQEFPQLTAVEDGFITVFGGYGGAPWNPQLIPNPALPNGVIAPLWSDLELSVANGRGMRAAWLTVTATGDDLAAIQWDNPHEWGADPTDPNTAVGKFQIFFWPNPSPGYPQIMINYGAMNALPDLATIGVESFAGDRATAVLNQGDSQGVVQSNSRICLDYVPAPAPTITLEYDVTVDANAESGTYTNNVVHNTDDPYAKDVTTSVDVVVDATEAFVESTVGAFDPNTGQWHLRDSEGEVTTFYFGAPGDIPLVGDWDNDGVDTVGVYRPSNQTVYLRNSNNTGFADESYVLGNGTDTPIAGDWDGDGYATVSLYRMSSGQVFIYNSLGDGDDSPEVDIEYWFGVPGDKPFAGDFDADGADTLGLHRESSGIVYFTNAHETAFADNEFYYGDPGDRLVAGDWGIVDGIDTPAVFRPSNTTWYFRYTNDFGVADSEFVWGEAHWLPVAGTFGLTD